MRTDEATGRALNANLEAFVAALNTAAYQVALRHGLKGPFIDVELDLWQALRAVVAAHLAQEAPVLPDNELVCGLLYLTPRQGEV